ncbi:MAG: cytochrome c [Alphaproteobacteria bacterium]|nr:cytochrome c [Alphaproteobacteria bacterium]
MTYPRPFIAVTTLLMLFSASVAAHSGATGVVKERMDRFTESQKSMKVIARALKSSQFDEVADHAERILIWSVQMEDLFPQGSNPKPSEALDTIWQQPEAFAKAAQTSADAAARLMALAEDGDGTAATAAFKELAASCSSCHRKFRK